MDDPIIASVRAVIDLGMPAVVLVQSIVLYRALSAMTDRYISTLELLLDKPRSPSPTPPLSLIHI